MFHKSILYLISFILMISGLYACTQKPFYESNLALPEQTWGSDKAAVFDFNISDTIQKHNLTITISSTDDYRNSNLWLFVYLHSENTLIAGDTLEYLLSDEKGKCLGEEKGASWNYSFIYKSNVGFPKTGKYSVEINQGMRDLKLKGIKEVGFKIEKIK